MVAGKAVVFLVLILVNLVVRMAVLNLILEEMVLEMCFLIFLAVVVGEINLKVEIFKLM